MLSSSTRPASAMNRMPWRIAIRRRFRRMSPFSTWLNSCATTPWSSSRAKRRIEPSVMPITASALAWPAAKALMPSSGNTYTGGTGTPAASAISSTTFNRRRSAGSVLAGSSRRPPSISATALPPLASCRCLNRQASAIPPQTTAVTIRKSSGLTRPSGDKAPKATATARLVSTTSAITAALNSNSRRVVLRRARSCALKKSMAALTAARAQKDTLGAASSCSRGSANSSGAASEAWPKRAASTLFGKLWRYVL